MIFQIWHGSKGQVLSEKLNADEAAAFGDLGYTLDYSFDADSTGAAQQMFVDKVKKAQPQTKVEVVDFDAIRKEN